MRSLCLGMNRCNCCARYILFSPSSLLSYLRGFSLSSWDEIVPKFKYNSNQPYFNILVHTVDSIRMASLLETCLEVRLLYHKTQTCDSVIPKV